MADFRTTWRRIGGEDLNPEMICPKCKFKVGDVVVIKEWDDMRAVNNFNTLWPEYDGLSFTEPMRRFCGLELTIASIEHYKYNERTTRLRFKEVLDPNHDWVIADWMVELVNVVEVSNSDLMSVLGGTYAAE